MSTATLASSTPPPAPPDLYPSHGGAVCRWIEDNLVHGEGDYYGQPFRLRPEQRLLLWHWYEYLPGTTTWRYRKAYIQTPKGWGKTELVAAMALAEFCGPVAPTSPNVPVAAASFEQADLLFGRAKQMCTHEDSGLRPFVEAYDTEILIKGQPGRMYRVAAVAGTNDGGLPTLFVADEVHEWTGGRERLHLVMGNSLAKRANGREINLSTPGDDLDGLAGRLHLKGLRVTAGEDEDPEYLFTHHTADDALDLNRPDELERAIRQANVHADEPLIANLRRRYTEVPEHEFRRYHLAQWVDAPIDSWLSDKPGAWEACVGDASIPDQAEVFAGIDMALHHDSIAVAIAHRRDDGRMAVQARVWEPVAGKLDHLDVMEHIRSLARRYTLVSASYDPRFFEVPAQLLIDEGLAMIETPQSPERMVPACGHAYGLIVNGQIVHDGSPTLTDHIKSAVQRTSERGWTLSKGKSKRKIDGCIAMVLALWEAERRHEAAEEGGWMVGLP